MMITDRASAKAAGEKWYFTGKPCKNGHIAPRQVANGNCKECAKATEKRHYEKCAHRRVSRNPNYYKENKAKAEASRKRWRDENIEKCRAYGRKASLAWAKRNPSKCAEKEARRRAHLSNATMPSACSVLISLFYDAAREAESKTGIKHHVDHIIPLRGKDVCGLHVPSNLQILTQRENCQKHNKHQNGVAHGHRDAPSSRRQCGPARCRILTCGAR